MAGELQPLADAAKALAGPINTVVKSIANGCERLYEPLHQVRMAKSAANASFIERLAANDIAELSEAYRERFDYRNARRQLNLGLIADRVAEHFKKHPTPTPHQPDETWVEEFEDSAQAASTAEMRVLWSRILAAEISREGAVPRRYLRMLRELDPYVARKFTLLLSCSVLGTGRLVLTFNGWEAHHGLAIFDLKELALVGLIEPLSQIKQSTVVREGFLRFFNRTISFSSIGDEVPLEYVLFTRFGEVLGAVTDATPNQAYFAALCAAMSSAKWKYQVDTLVSQGAAESSR